MIAASFLHPFEKIVGIEYLENLHLIALDIQTKFYEKIQEIFKSDRDLFPNYKSLPELDFVNADFLLKDWTDASFIFANSTCFSPELMQNLSKKAEELKAGTFFVTFTKKLPNLSENWEIREGFRRLMSWGIATVYVHRKKK